MANDCVCVSAAGEAAAGERDVGWGRVCLFLQTLGKTADSRSLSLAHCDLTATDLLELGAQPPPRHFFLSSPFCLLAQPTSGSLGSGLHLQAPTSGLYLISHFLLSANSDASGAASSAGGAGRLLERADWRMSGGTDLPPPPCSRTESAEAVRLSPERRRRRRPGWVQGRANALPGEELS